MHVDNFEQLGHRTPAVDLRTVSGLVNTLRKADHIISIVEVGVWTGMTTLALSHPDTVVWCVDTWEGNPIDQTGKMAGEMGPDAVCEMFLKNMGDRIPSRVHSVRMSSVRAAAHWPRMVDMVYIDANHDYEDVKADIDAWWPHVAPGGILAGHDYNSHSFPGVVRAVEEFGPSGTRGNCWWRYKV